MEFDKELFKESIRSRFKRHYGKKLEEANKHDIYDAVSSAVMDHIQTNWIATRSTYEDADTRQMYTFRGFSWAGR